MLRDLQRWRETTPNAGEEDWIFASPRMHGRQPLWPEAVIRTTSSRRLSGLASPSTSLGIASGIASRPCWWTINNDVKTAQHMMRHANSRVTLELYTGAIDEKIRRAQGQIVEQVLTGRVLATQAAGNA